ncbi:hypothetical protein [Amycolatopsis sp. NPDC004625]|uniref:hypothetical protein n=1 Tax=Amycolatopsis sp. NPDC004625 TaxID=3154670 RepID=UPI0033B63C3F
MNRLMLGRQLAGWMVILGQSKFRGDLLMNDAPFPEPDTPQPEVVVLRRERNRWLRREANLVMARRGDEAIAREARTAHLVLTFALAVLERRPTAVGSYADLAQRPGHDSR